MEEKMTIKEVLEATVTSLSNISVPVAFTEAIAVPVARAVNNINACLQAFENSKVEGKTEEKTEE